MLETNKKFFKKIGRSILASLVADYAASLPTAGGKILLILKPTHSILQNALNSTHASETVYFIIQRDK